MGLALYPAFRANRLSIVEHAALAALRGLSSSGQVCAGPGRVAPPWRPPIYSVQLHIDWRSSQPLASGLGGLLTYNPYCPLMAGLSAPAARLHFNLGRVSPTGGGLGDRYRNAEKVPRMKLRRFFKSEDAVSRPHINGIDQHDGRAEGANYAKHHLVAVGPVHC